MRKIYTITFHASHNCGSCLQAYALQEFVKTLSNDCEYKIINLRKPVQDEMNKLIFYKKGIKNKIRSIILLPYKNAFIKRNDLFEKFINEKLNLTKEYKSLEQIKNDNIKGDCFISGSDQIWNMCATDFDFANYLEFCSDCKKISYAASFGPNKQKFDYGLKERIYNDLKNYSSISVREEESYNYVKKILGTEENLNINVDPTLLLPKEFWVDIIPRNRLIKEKYIFLYDLKNNQDTYKLAKKISKKLKLPVVVCKYNSLKNLTYSFKKRFDTGPAEFLNLILNAELVLSTSFHGTVFSVIFEKKFYSVNGVNDYRIASFLKKLNLEDRTINLEDYESKIKNYKVIDYTSANKVICNEINKATNFLKQALELNERNK